MKGPRCPKIDRKPDRPEKQEKARRTVPYCIEQIIYTLGFSYVKIVTVQMPSFYRELICSDLPVTKPIAIIILSMYFILFYIKYI